MAYFPCDQGLHAFRGRSASVYVAVNYGTDTDRWKMRLCPEHAAIVEDLLRPCEVSANHIPTIERPSFPCLTCGGATVGDEYRMMFITGYFVGQERRDFWTMLHPSCPDPALLRAGATVN